MAARQVIRFLKAARVSFSTFDERATGACEFYRQMTARKTLAVNPKSNVTYTTTLSGTEPLIQLDFIDGSKKTLQVPDKNVRDILEEIDMYCSQIEAKYEEEGKNIE